MKNKLTNALGWTNENKPTRQSLLDGVIQAQKDAEGMGRMYGDYEDLNEKQKKYVDALALLDVWEYDFGPRIDPPLRMAENMVPIPSQEEQLAKRRVSSGFSQDILGPYAEPLSQIKDSTNPNKPIERTSLPGHYAIHDASCLFTDNPKTVKALDQINSRKCESNIMEYDGGYLPAVYLAVTFTQGKMFEAVEALSKDLCLLAESGSIVGNLSPPKILDLGSIDGFLPISKAMYCWPFVDTNKLAKSVGKDFALDFKYSHYDLLKFVGVKNCTVEGSLGNEIS